METAVVRRFGGARRRLIETLAERGITDVRVLKAFDDVPRHLFVPTGVQHRAYEDTALPIGSGQTISQPWAHASALAALRLTGRERVLEVGSGSGVQSALLTRLVDQVFSIERVSELATAARDAFRACGIDRVVQRVGDGTLGWPEFAPFDAILVGAAGPAIPAPLRAQLAVGGQLLMPVGERTQQLVRLRRTAVDAWEETPLDPVRFVPLIGRHGFPG
ncbi:MAG: protein-L-isoaspartate(D-aspartate) O-methyltransferase [Gemmatimonadaceae bacterium]